MSGKAMRETLGFLAVVPSRNRAAREPEERNPVPGAIVEESLYGFLRNNPIGSEDGK